MHRAVRHAWVTAGRSGYSGQLIFRANLLLVAAVYGQLWPITQVHVRPGFRLCVPSRSQAERHIMIVCPGCQGSVESSYMSRHGSKNRMKSESGKSSTF